MISEAYLTNKLFSLSQLLRQHTFDKGFVIRNRFEIFILRLNNGEIISSSEFSFGENTKTRIAFLQHRDKYLIPTPKLLSLQNPQSPHVSPGKENLPKSSFL